MSSSPNDSQPKPGRPPMGDKPMGKHLVTLDDSTAHGLRLLGGGNLSAGIRAAWQMLKAIMPLRKK